AGPDGIVGTADDTIGVATVESDVSGRVTAESSNNLIGDGTGLRGLEHGVNGNQVGTRSRPINPLLGPLQDNGGRTPTHALLPLNTAINAGNPTFAPPTDQRGVARADG